MPNLRLEAGIHEALGRVLQPGQDIVVGQGYGSPRALVGALSRHRELLAGSRIFIGMLLADLPELPETTIRTFFPSGGLASASALAAPRVEYVRESLYGVAHALRAGDLSVDVALAQATLPRNGFHSLGATVDYMGPAVDRAEAVVLEVGAAVPWTGARTIVRADDRVVAVGSEARPVPLRRVASNVERAIAAHVADWIPDGATLQLGMASWVEPLAAALRERRCLRVHSGLAGAWVADLHEAGACARGAPIVATGAGGPEEFYAWLDRTDDVEFAPADVTHAPEALAALPTLRAVNSVFELDLLGRANCEIGPAGRRSGIGGLPDFAAAAARAGDGLSIVALCAVGRDGSRIVPLLDDAAVSLPAGLVDVVVTEYGSVDLRALHGAERAKAMLQLAAPVHRVAIERAARELDVL